jgi:hypothetical protein
MYTKNGEIKFSDGSHEYFCRVVNHKGKQISSFMFQSPHEGDELEEVAEDAAEQFRRDPGLNDGEYWNEDEALDFVIYKGDQGSFGDPPGVYSIMWWNEVKYAVTVVPVQKVKKKVKVKK